MNFGFESCGVHRPHQRPRHSRPLLVGELRHRRHLVSRHLLRLHRPRHVRSAATRHLHLLLPLDLRLLGPLLRQRHLRLLAHQLLPSVQRQMAIPRSLAEMIIQFLLLILLLGRRLSVWNELMQIHRLHERLHRLRHLRRALICRGARKGQRLQSYLPRLVQRPGLRVATRGHRPLDRRHHDRLDLRLWQRRLVVDPFLHLRRRPLLPDQSLPLKRLLFQWLERDGLLDDLRVLPQSLLTGSARRTASRELAAEAEHRRTRSRRHGVRHERKAPIYFARSWLLAMLLLERVDGEVLVTPTSRNRLCTRCRRWTRWSRRLTTTACTTTRISRRRPWLL